VSVEIPYTTTPRPDTGVTNPALGMWLFLSSEAMLFGSLFSAYALLRSGAQRWPDQSSLVSVPLGSINTVLLVASSVTLGLALSALRAGDRGTDDRDADDRRAALDGPPHRYRLFMAATIVLGLVFLGIKGFEWNEKLSHGALPSTNNFLALYFTLTGLHALHLAGGILVNLYLWGPGRSMWQTEPARYAGRVAAARLYWNFVDAIWIVLFTVLYLL
jgi:heme/copper-type cytochrome/quinol oxidase subunit 3